MPNNRQLKVFLCHSKDDKPKVRELYRHLVTDGYNAWLDEEKLMPGQDWDLEIRKAVRESDAVIVCLSNSSTTKAGYVQKEIHFALDVADEQPEGAIFIIPAKLEDCQVPVRLSKWQWVNLYEETGKEKLKNSLRGRSKALGIISESLFAPIAIHIPQGKFLMGSTHQQAEHVLHASGNMEWAKWLSWEQPQHEVELSEYFISKFLVTNREYKLFVHETGYTPPHRWKDGSYQPGKENHPVVNVSWFDANEYCKWLSDKIGNTYRLPTEAEWEKAARGIDGRIWSWGNDFAAENANTHESLIGDTTPIGKYSPEGDSPYGCADMIGNVSEWCADWISEKEYEKRKGLVQNPHGPQHGRSRVFRGGSFNDDSLGAHCAFRNAAKPDRWSRYVGFRMVLYPRKE